MKEWIVKARRELSEVGRSGIGDELTSEQLANVPAGDTGRWPPALLAELIDTIGSHRPEAGISIGHINARGDTVHAPEHDRATAVALDRPLTPLDLDRDEAAG